MLAEELPADRSKSQEEARRLEVRFSHLERASVTSQKPVKGSDMTNSKRSDAGLGHTVRLHSQRSFLVTLRNFVARLGSESVQDGCSCVCWA